MLAAVDWENQRTLGYHLREVELRGHGARFVAGRPGGTRDISDALLLSCIAPLPRPVTSGGWGRLRRVVRRVPSALWQNHARLIPIEREPCRKMRHRGALGRAGHRPGRDPCGRHGRHETSIECNRVG